MSWQAYIDESLVGTGNLDKAAIYGNDEAPTHEAWAASPDFKIESTEINAIIKVLNNSNDEKIKFDTQSKGFHVAGERYVVLKADERSLYGKKGREGVVIVKTGKALLITHYPESVQPGVATNTVEVLADYLIKVGY